MKVFGIEVQVTNKRKVHCGDCKKPLETGEGIGHRYPMFHGTGEYYYLCVDCDQKRKDEAEATPEAGL